MAIYNLKLIPTGYSLSSADNLTWDSNTGDLLGDMSQDIQVLADDAKKNGIVTEPFLGLTSNLDPLRNESAMVILIMSAFYKVPAELEEFLPAVVDYSKSNPSDIEIIY